MRYISVFIFTLLFLLFNSCTSEVSPSDLSCNNDLGQKCSKGYLCYDDRRMSIEPRNKARKIILMNFFIRGEKNAKNARFIFQ